MFPSYWEELWHEESRTLGHTLRHVSLGIYYLIWGGQQSPLNSILMKLVFKVSEVKHTLADW